MKTYIIRLKQRDGDYIWMPQEDYESLLKHYGDRFDDHYSEVYQAEPTYDVIFHDSQNSNSKGFERTEDYCRHYVKTYNGTKESYFEDYKGGMVQIVCNQTQEVVFESEIL